MTHIGFDARYIRVTHHDGISRFSARIGSEIWALCREERKARVTFIISDERQLEHLPQGADHVLASSPTSLRERRIARDLNRYGFDVVFSPMQTIGSRGRKYPLVLTVHDLIYYNHPMPPREFNFFVRVLWRLYHLSWWPQRLLLTNCESVVAVSRTTAELISNHRLTPRAVSVVYNATDLSSTVKVAPRTHSPREKNIIYMGSFMPYKNVETLVRVANNMPEYTLHLLSRIHDADRRRLEKIVRGNNVVFHNGVSDEEYVEFLAGASALVTASKAEGFGIPVIEALAMGTPVVASEIPIFDEVADSAAILCPPDDVASFVAGIHSLESDATHAHFSAAGLTQAQKFNWSISAKSLLDVLKNIANA